MKNPNAGSAPQTRQRRSQLFLILRWMTGALVGFLSSFILLMLAFQGMLFVFEGFPLGQLELIDSVIRYLSGIVPIPDDSIFGLSIILYSAIWGLIGALLASGRMKQITIGVVLSVLYVVFGCVYSLMLLEALMN